MSRWECNSGHVLEGLFYEHLRTGSPVGMPEKIECPFCRSEMLLARTEGASPLLNRIRDFIGKVSENPDLVSDGTRALADLGRLEIVVRKMADEASRP